MLLFPSHTGTQNGHYRQWIKTLQVGKRFISVDREAVALDKPFRYAMILLRGVYT